MNSTMTLGNLLDSSLERFSKPLRILRKKMKFRDSIRDNILRKKHIANYRALIVMEEAGIEANDKAQAIIKSDLRAMGVKIE